MSNHHFTKKTYWSHNWKLFYKRWNFHLQYKICHSIFLINLSILLNITSDMCKRLYHVTIIESKGRIWGTVSPVSHYGSIWNLLDFLVVILISSYHCVWFHVWPDLTCPGSLFSICLWYFIWDIMMGNMCIHVMKIIKHIYLDKTDGNNTKLRLLQKLDDIWHKHLMSELHFLFKHPFEEV